MSSHAAPRKLSYVSFVESFGKAPVESTDCKSRNRRRSIFARSTARITSTPKPRLRDSVSSTIEKVASSQDDLTIQVSTSARKETRSERMSRKLRDFSLKRRGRSICDSNEEPNSMHRSRSVAILGKIPVAPSRPLSAKAGKSIVSTESSALPMSKTISVAHRGYISIHHRKKKSWKRYWCILQDLCLYCYCSQGADFADDIIALGGYTVRKCYGPIFYLELPGKGSRTYVCKGDDEASRDEWVAALDQNIAPVKSDVIKPERFASHLHTSPRKTAETLTSDLDTSKVKALLLAELNAQQREIIREQQRIEQFIASKRRPSPPCSQKSSKSGSLLSLAQIGDHGYCSSFDGLSDCGNTGSNSISPRSCRSRSAASVAACESSEGQEKSAEVYQRVLAEIEEFRNFSLMVIKQKQQQQTESSAAACS